MKKLSILMPVYNDEGTISKSIMSILDQSYKNFELIIINDGSTDNTELKIKEFKDPRIKYLKQSNQDQLNALLNGSSFIDGDIIGMLHGDDLLPDSNTYQRIVDYFELNDDCDAIYGDILQIDNDDVVRKAITSSNFVSKQRVMARLILNLGRNLYNDVFYAKNDCFEALIKNNYIIWNTPFWIDLQKNPKLLNVNKVDFPTLKYRINEDNYINDTLGKFNVVNGNLRTVTQLIKYYHIPFFQVQYFLYRLFAKLQIADKYHPLYQKKPFKKPARLIKLVIEKRAGSNYNDNPYFRSLINFYKNSSNREVNLNMDKLLENDIYYGKDMRIFNKLILQNNLPDFYLNIFNEMDKGFGKIVVKSGQYNKAMNLIKFLNINNVVVEEVE